MPKRSDLQRILVIGSGPIVIGQACEFDYSGTQACKVLQREGFHVSLVNSNPATIMTDPEFAERLAGLGARVVELAGLADDDRSGADEEDLLEVGPLGHAGP